MASGTKHICLIGGGGFIGTAFGRYLRDQGHRVSVIGRRSGTDAGLGYYSVSDSSYEELGRILAGSKVDLIFDFAYSSVPGTSFQDPVRDFSDNLNNVIRHLELARCCSPARYVYISSGGTVYGDPGAARAFRETDPNFPLSPYGITKMACERYVHMYHRLHGLPALIVRPSNIYGPGQKPFRGQGLVATALGLAYRGDAVQIFGDGSHIRDYLYIDDFCAGLAALLEQEGTGEIYNLGYGEGHSILELIGCVDEAVAPDGLALRRSYQPGRPFDVHYNVLDIARIRNATGWRPQTSLGEGVRRTWDWIKAYMNH